MVVKLCSLTFREELRLRVFENKLLRKILEAMRKNYGRMERVT